MVRASKEVVSVISGSTKPPEKASKKRRDEDDSDFIMIKPGESSSKKPKISSAASIFCPRDQKKQVAQVLDAESKRKAVSTLVVKDKKPKITGSLFQSRESKEEVKRKVVGPVSVSATTNPALLAPLFVKKAKVPLTFLKDAAKLSLLEDIEEVGTLHALLTNSLL